MAEQLNRRDFLSGIAAISAGLLCPDVVKAATQRDRTLVMYCPHLGEMFRTVYWTPRDGYISESMAQITHAFRDRHDNSMTPIDPRLIDQLFFIQQRIAPREPLHLFSGYRSPTTNARLRRSSSRVARNSFHMKGQAADIHLPRHATATIRKAALSLKAGGVGFYPGSRFVHIDSGPVRAW